MMRLDMPPCSLVASPRGIIRMRPFSCRKLLRFTSLAIGSSGV